MEPEETEPPKPPGVNTMIGHLKDLKKADAEETQALLELFERQRKEDADRASSERRYWMLGVGLVLCALIAGVFAVFGVKLYISTNGVGVQDEGHHVSP